jgi:hypothetical protein
LRGQLGNQLVDRSLREVSCSREHSFGILIVEVRSEASRAAQVQPAVGEHREDKRVAAEEAGHRDAQVGLGVREMEPLGRVRVHRRACFAQVETARIHLGQMGDQL